MHRISFAFRSFFSILFGGSFAPDIALAFGYTKPMPLKTAAPPKPQAGPADGAVQMLAILQRDARLVDFLMEDISGYSDEQVGAAVRDVQAQSRQSIGRYLRLEPVIDGVEGDYTKITGTGVAGAGAVDSIKLIGNVPASGKAPGGLLRHKGWKAAQVDLPSAAPTMILAPAEVEVE